MRGRICLFSSPTYFCELENYLAHRKTLKYVEGKKERERESEREGEGEGTERGREREKGEREKGETEEEETGLNSTEGG